MEAVKPDENVLIEPIQFCNLLTPDLPNMSINRILIECLIRSTKMNEKLSVISTVFLQFDTLLNKVDIIQSKINLLIEFSKNETDSNKKLDLFSEAIDIARHNIKDVNIVGLAPIIIRMGNYAAYADLISLKVGIEDQGDVFQPIPHDKRADCSYLLLIFDAIQDSIEERQPHNDDDPLYRECLQACKLKSKEEQIEIRSRMIDHVTKHNSSLLLKFIMDWLGKRSLTEAVQLVSSDNAKKILELLKKDKVDLSMINLLIKYYEQNKKYDPLLNIYQALIVYTDATAVVGKLCINGTVTLLDRIKYSDMLIMLIRTMKEQSVMVKDDIVKRSEQYSKLLHMQKSLLNSVIESDKQDKEFDVIDITNNILSADILLAKSLAYGVPSLELQIIDFCYLSSKSLDLIGVAKEAHIRLIGQKGAMRDSWPANIESEYVSIERNCQQKNYYQQFFVDHISMFPFDIMLNCAESMNCKNIALNPEVIASCFDHKKRHKFAWFIRCMVDTFNIPIEDVLDLYVKVTQFILNEKEKEATIYPCKILDDEYIFRVVLLIIYMLNIIIQKSATKMTNSTKFKLSCAIEFVNVCIMIRTI
jgi:hypothetical protein